jgi:long-chain acyl-CoA synthetase
MTLDQIVRRNALRFSAKQALRCGDTVRSWRELDERVDRIANALLASGLTSGDRVALLLSNCAEFVELYFAIARSGLIAVPLNFRLTLNELRQVLAHAEPSLFIAGAEYAAHMEQIVTLFPQLRGTWVVGDGQWTGAQQFEERLAAAASAPVRSHGSEHDTFAIFYTSGTTGLPKGAMVSHYNLEMNSFNQFIADGSLASDVNLVATPLYHMGAVFMAVTYMMLGCTQVILPRFEPAAWLKAMQDSRATVCLLIPTMINMVLNDSGLEKHDLSALRLIFYGGGPMPPAVLERAISKLRCAFTQGYGLTETLEATFLVASDHVLHGTEQQQRRLHSAGREAVGAEVRIVDDRGSDLHAGEIGEILVRSRSVISGYWGAPEETATAIRDGWFCTGDLGYLDEDRYLFVVDRKKDMVVSGGVNIYTKEIESVLFTHPAVLEAAVIGLPDEEWGEVVTAVVVVRENHRLTAAEVVDHCRKSLAGYKKPRRVFFQGELPKNPSGKVLKRELRKDLQGRT